MPAQLSNFILFDTGNRRFLLELLAPTGRPFPGTADPHAALRLTMDAASEFARQRPEIIIFPLPVQPEAKVYGDLGWMRYKLVGGQLMAQDTRGGPWYPHPLGPKGAIEQRDYQRQVLANYEAMVACLEQR